MVVKCHRNILTYYLLITGIVSKERAGRESASKEVVGKEIASKQIASSIWSC